MKTKKRKALEMEALLIGITVTYAFNPPSRFEGKYGDRWYSRKERKYYTYQLQTLEYISFIDPWRSIGAKTFFDLSEFY